ncbi:Serine/arginine-rich splicing factor RS2Z33 [Habropoda laboriosa]|uniref:Serine/arginine-rich splicing factor RS2Z33 n=1 Tax=Habropoda laboriosa TaxID=597456 RepID=A0A0L7QVY5_9HYME|nr:Serine/arginine-rich splicing factor RS2Z33 [Habropoda laboriosa]
MKDIRLGWNRCRVREFKAAGECFRCGAMGHFARDCKEQSKRCYRCGSEQHLVKDCEQTEKTVRQPTRRRPPGRGTTEWPELSSARSSKSAANVGATSAGISASKSAVSGARVHQERRETAKTRSVGTQTDVSCIEGSPRRTGWADAVKRPPPPRREGRTSRPPPRRERAAEPTATKKTATPRRRRARGVAVVVRHETTKYEDALKAIRSHVRDEEMTGIKSVRRTMAGEILFELEEDDRAKPWKERLESIPGVAKVRRLGPRDAVKIRGIDALTDNEAILKAVSDTTAMTEEENEQAQTVRAILELWQERVVVALLPSRAAKELCSKDKFKIGWSNARARLLSGPGRRCRACGWYGHSAEKCQRKEGQNQQPKN